jgi:hypothetical protein
MIEQTALRTYTSKTFDNPDGSHTLHAHIGHIHYKDSQGDFQDSDITFSDQGTYWQMTKHNYRLYIAKDFGASQLMRFDNKFDGANHTIYYEPHSIWWVNKNNPSDRTKIRDAQSVTGVLSGHKIIYTNAFGNGIDFEITIRRSGFKKEIVIPNQLPLNPPTPDHKPVVLFKYEATGLKLKANDSAQDWDDDSYYESEEGFTVREAVAQYESKILPAYIVDSHLPVERRQKLKIFWEKRNGVLWQAKVIPLNFLNNATYPVRLDTTTSYYAGGGDGKVTTFDDGTWAGARDAATGDSADDSTQYSIAGASIEGGPLYGVQRSYFPCDTSGIPAAATITAATFYVEVYAISDGEADAQGYITIVQTHQPDATELTTADFDQIYTTKGTDSDVDITGLGTGSYTSWALNATGLAWIPRSGETLPASHTAGYAHIGVREGHDFEDSAPDVGNSKVDFQTSDTAGTSSDPYLSVTYLNNYTITCDAGSYAITGTAMNTLMGRKVACAAGSYAVTGTAMTPLHAKKLALDAGSYALTGTAMTPLHNKKITCDAGSYAITGTAATLTYTEVDNIFGSARHQVQRQQQT